MTGEQVLQEIAGIMTTGGLLSDTADLVLRAGERYLILSDTGTANPRAADLAWDDLAGHGAHGYLLQAAFAANRGTTAALFSTGQFVMAAGRVGRTVRPMLDDLAQLIGPSLPCASAAGEVRRILSRRSAVLWHGGGCICTGATVSDAHAVAMVAEKGSRVQIESAYLGGGHTIGRVDAMIMRFIYLMKYRKRAGER